MSQSDQQQDINESRPVSLKDIVIKIRNGIRYLKAKWVIIIIFGILGALAGLAYSILKKPVYTAVCTFVLDDGNRSSLGQYADLASLAGFSLGGSGGGMFQGDNIIELYKSRLMIEKALLTNVNIKGKNELLIERYISFNELRPKWKEKDEIDSINFFGDPEKFNRKQDSIITNIVELFNKESLNVSKPDKKLSIIRVEVSSKDELFAKEFNNTLVSTVNDFYIKTITKKSAQNVRILQRQADSIKGVLNNSITGVASAIDASPNPNPTLVSLRVPSQKKQVDVQASGAIYSQIEQNLEIAKIGLRQATPLIQVIDQPFLPLTKTHIGKIKALVLGFILFVIFTVITLILIRLYKKSMSTLT